MKHEQETCDRHTSEPPTAKTITAGGMALAMVIAQLTELAAAGLATYALVADKISSEIWLAVLLGSVVGPAVGKARGKLGGPTTALVIGALGKGALAEALRRLLV